MNAIWNWLLQVTGTSNMTGRWYGFWSGFGANLGELAIVGVVIRHTRAVVSQAERHHRERLKDREKTP